MRKALRFSAMLMIASLFSFLTVYSQSITVSGTVKNSATNVGEGGVSVKVKNGTEGTVTDNQGGFRLGVRSLPVVLVFTSVGFESQEVTVANADQPVLISFIGTTSLGQEVVVSTTRTAVRLIDAPVTVERISAATLRNIPAPSYYEAISNLKGVDMHTASLTFRTMSTRGFVASGNTRLNQLVDGMDNQAPGLNFSVGSVIGLTELDVDNIEVLSGASSALYGSGGMNGTILINSKNPFNYQGLSFQVKQGIMHVNDRAQGVSPYYDWSFRYGKAIGKKFAFKIGGQYLKARDWEANDYRNINRTNVISQLKGGDRVTDPNFDGVNIYGDETTALLNDRSFNNAGNLLYNIAGALATSPATPAVLVPQLLALRQQYGTYPSRIDVSRTGYAERDLVDYNTQNFKATAGLFYRITPGIEASLNTYFGTGTTVYTGADRYSLKDLKIAQHKLELKASHWLVRVYTTQENAGNAYQATALGRLLNEAWKPTVTFANGVPSIQQTDWLFQYAQQFLLYKAQAQANGVVPNDFAAHQAARAFADIGRPLPGSDRFNTLTRQVKSTAIPRGARFNDKTDLWAGEAQVNVSDALDFTNTVELIAGVQGKQYVLNSEGTLFSDTAGKIKVHEIGGYAQLKKKFFNEFLTVILAGRYDKHENFEGRFTPRVAAVLKVAPNNNIRLSYQTAYRFPTNQDQYINLNTGSAILIGALPEFRAKYNIPGNPIYTVESVTAYRQGGNPANTSVLVPASFEDMRPETVSSYEIGYKGLIARKLFVDGYLYYSKYKDFLGRIAVSQSLTGSQSGVFNSLTSRNLSYIQNSNQEVKAIGWGVSAEYRLPKNFTVYGNVFSDDLRDVPPGLVTSFNAPLYRYNIGLRNESFYKGIGFNVVFKWQDNVYYEGTFATGTLPAFGFLDGQVSYRIPKTKSTFRIGGTNLGNRYYRTGFGSPYVGGLYYASYGYNL